MIVPLGQYLGLDKVKTDDCPSALGQYLGLDKVKTDDCP